MTKGEPVYIEKSNFIVNINRYSIVIMLITYRLSIVQKSREIDTRKASYLSEQGLTFDSDLTSNSAFGPTYDRFIHSFSKSVFIMNCNLQYLHFSAVKFRRK